MDVLRQTIDGSSVSIRAPAGEQLSRPSSVATYAINGRWQEFTTSDRDGGRAVADTLGVALTQTFSYQQGTLSLGTKSFHSKDTDGSGVHVDLMHFGLWEGRQSSVFTHLYNGNAQELIPVFEAFTIVESPEGAWLLPKNRRQVTLAREPSFLQEFSELGLLLVRPLTKSLARNLPSWSGTPTSGGELFVGRRPDSVHFVLVGQRSLTEVMPDGTDCDKDVPIIASLQVAWQPGSLVAPSMRG
jgi:hypothetical protein